ncbi:MAG: hypothetical protein KGK14_10960 [Bacteroidota bacterium]|jgi:hypothetical protein|nr:hypothetical protein [Bacteroidota bacterium]
MKMLVITSIKEDLLAVTHILEKAKVPVFSVTDTIGHKSEHNNYVLNNWFASGDAQTSALFFFSFTDDDKAAHAIEEVKKFNNETPSAFPIRAFIVPVEASSY